ncbi:zinc transporter ZIP9-B-like [Clavelina lepadiformis]|uniref:Zinc transporter ZIP9 n=1 Tax=Clavelina lepadiformis TaxID=159417 RepID=A0ABP0FE01_CLALP
MAEFWTICLLSFAMLIGCLVSGWIPLAFSLSPRKIQLFTIFGAGLLVGTALAVIIPEGVETMYSSQQTPNNMHVKLALDNNEAEVSDGESTKSQSINQEIDFAAVETTEHLHQHNSPHREIGLALLLGFVFMLLVDQIGGATHSHAPDIRLDELNQSKLGSSRSQLSDQKSKGHTATIGLVVHAAADGIALGAAASTDRHDLQLIVFIAIMLHKAPAAFGLVSFLVHEGLEVRRVKKHLLIFAIAAPLLAIVTFCLLNQKDRQFLSEVNATGIAMLFSAGTFLYVATVHVLPEIAHSGSNKGLNICEVSVLVSGSLFPLLLNLSHSH